MGELPVDARRVVDELRARRRASHVAPSSWSPPESFQAHLGEAIEPPVHMNEDLAWLHRNHVFGALVEAGNGNGVRGGIKRVQRRVIVAVLGPFFAWLQEWVDHEVRAVDAVSRRADDIAARQLALFDAVREDVVDLARHVDDLVGR